jgi:hypothetical protein
MSASDQEQTAAAGVADRVVPVNELKRKQRECESAVELFQLLRRNLTVPKPIDRHGPLMPSSQ